jgi:hypothetical protein
MVCFVRGIKNRRAERACGMMNTKDDGLARHLRSRRYAQDMLSKNKNSGLHNFRTSFLLLGLTPQFYHKFQ